MTKYLLLAVLLICGCSSDNNCQLTDDGWGAWDAVNCKRVTVTYYSQLRDRWPTVEVIVFDKDGVELCAVPPGSDVPVTVCQGTSTPFMVSRFEAKESE